VNAVTVNISRSRSTQAKEQTGIRSTQENKRSASEGLTQCVYSKIVSVIIICKFCLTIYPINRDIESRTHKLLDALPGNTSQCCKCSLCVAEGRSSQYQFYSVFFEH
jgi:hypothetical protein